MLGLKKKLTAGIFKRGKEQEKEKSEENVEVPNAEEISSLPPPLKNGVEAESKPSLYSEERKQSIVPSTLSSVKEISPLLTPRKRSISGPLPQSPLKKTFVPVSRLVELPGNIAMSPKMNPQGVQILSTRGGEGSGNIAAVSSNSSWMQASSLPLGPATYERIMSGNGSPAAGTPSKKLVVAPKKLAVPPPVSLRMSFDSSALNANGQAKLPMPPFSGVKKMTAKKMSSSFSLSNSGVSAVDDKVKGKVLIPVSGDIPPFSKKVPPPPLAETMISGLKQVNMISPSKKSVMSSMPRRLSTPSSPQQVNMSKDFIYPPRQLSSSFPELHKDEINLDLSHDTDKDSESIFQFETNQSPLHMTKRPNSPPPFEREKSLSFISNQNSEIHFSVAKSHSESPLQLSPAKRLPSQELLPPSCDSLFNGKDSVPLEEVKKNEHPPPNPSPEVLPLTKELRRKIIGKLSTVLSPHQYYGKILKIVSIKPLKVNHSRLSSQASKSELSSSFINSIYVGSKDMEEANCYYPQLRLFESDGVPLPDGKPGVVETAITIHEAKAGKMLFANSDLDATQLFEHSMCDSCYVASSTCIKFKEPEKFVIPVAKLKIRWIVFSSPHSEPLCPVHHKEMQLFDPIARRLVCPLCASKHPSHRNKLVVIPDFLNAESRNEMLDHLSRKQQSAKRELQSLLTRHHLVSRMGANKKNAIQQQFNMVLDAIKTQQAEYISACENEFNAALGDIGKDVVTAVEKLEVLSAANFHLSSKSQLYAMQVTIVQEGLEAERLFPTTFSLSKENGDEIQIPELWNGIMPNLERLLSTVHQLNPYVGLSKQKRVKTGPTTNSFRTGENELGDHRENGKINSVEDGSAMLASGIRGISPTQQRSHSTKVRSPAHPAAMSPHRITVIPAARDFSPPPDSLKSSRSTSPRAQEYAYHCASEKITSYPLLTGIPNVGSSSSKVEQRPRATMTSGTLVFNYPIHDIVVDAFLDSNSGDDRKRRMSKHEVTVEWAIRMDDYGDWVGIGVGVGTPMESIGTPDSANDLSHLWLAPFGSGGETYLIRVIAQRNGKAKLHIHDRRGKQLDDGRIPQWNFQRACYPQVTFGGRVGRAELVEIPRRMN